MFIESKSANEGRAATVSPSICDQAVGNQAIGSIEAAIGTLKRTDGASRSLLRTSAKGAFAFFAGRTAKGGLPGTDASPVADVASRVHAGGMGLLSLAALTFSSVKDAHGADANVTSLDEDSIEYKDMPHGSFELVTKEAIPRYIIVEDPGQTVILNKVGTTIGVTQSTNSAARMDELQLAQQEVLANWAKGLGTTGSGATPFSDTLLPAQPINFIQPDGPAGLNALPALPAVELRAEFIFIPPPAPAPTVLTLNLGLGPTEVDTIVFDTFSATSGTFGATSSGSSAPLTYGISGGTAANTTVGGLAYNVSEAGEFGTLYVNSSTGAYTFVPDDAAINALKAPTTENFVVTVSDGTASDSQTFSIDINGVNDTADIGGDVTGSLGGGASAGRFAVASFAAAHAEAPRVATGTLTSTDVDDPANTFTAVTAQTPSDHGYGTFTMAANGMWTYTLDADNTAVRALNVGGTLTDTFTVTSVDGTPQVVKIVIGGWNDAAVISGDTAGCVVEAACRDPGVPIACGTLTSTDVDNPSDLFAPVKCGKSDGGYGTFTMTADGVWTYKLDNDNCVVQALDDCDTLTDTFTVTSIDGTEQVITITIKGADDRDGHHHHDHSDDRWAFETSASSDAAATSGIGSAADKGSAGVAAIPADTKAAVTSSPAAAPDAGESFQFKNQGSDSPAPETVTASDGGNASVSVEASETSVTAVVLTAVVANVIESCLVHDVSEDCNASGQKWVACHFAHDLVA